MGIFSRKDKSSSNASSSTRNSPSLAPTLTHSSTSSLKSPTTPGYGNMPVPPMIPKVELPRAPDPSIDPAGYLRSINSVRERSAVVLERAKGNRLEHFTVDMNQFSETTSFVVSIIKVSSRLLVPTDHRNKGLTA